MSEYDDNPSMGTVKHTTQLPLKMLTNEFGEEELDKFLEMDEEDNQMMEVVINESGVEGLLSMMWSQSMLENLQTICLARDEKLTFEDIDQMSANEYRNHLDESEEALGGSAQDFFDKLGIDTSLMQNLAQETEHNSSNNSGKQMQPRG